MFLALAKAQRALILVEDIRRKFSTLCNAAIVVGQHFSLNFSFFSVTQWTLLNVNVLRVAVFTTRKKAVSQIYSLPCHSVIAVFHHYTLNAREFNGKNS
jgi:hypothetical protein